MTWSRWLVSRKLNRYSMYCCLPGCVVELSAIRSQMSFVPTSLWNRGRPPLEHSLILLLGYIFRSRGSLQAVRSTSTGNGLQSQQTQNAGVQVHRTLFVGGRLILDRHVASVS